MAEDYKLITTSEISRRLGFHLSVTFIKSLGIEPLTERAARGSYWRETDYPEICKRLSAYCLEARGNQ